MKKFLFLFIGSLALLVLVLPIKLQAQSSFPKDSIMVAAKEIITETHFCALVTMDSTGQPQIRTMNPFPLKDEFVIWFATSRTSRKAKEIKANPKVCVYWADHVNAKGYVNVTGTAEVIDDKKLLVKMKREYWEGMVNWKEVFVLIKIVPNTIEVVNYKHGLNGDPKTFGAPKIVL